MRPIFSSTPVFEILPRMNFSNVAVAEAAMALKADLEASEYTDGSLNFWYANLVTWIIFRSPFYNEYQSHNYSIPPEKLKPWLVEFLRTDGGAHSIDLVYDDRGDIQVCFAGLFHSIRFACPSSHISLQASRMMGALRQGTSLPHLLSGSRDWEDIGKRWLVKYSSLVALQPAENGTVEGLSPYGPFFFALNQFDTLTTDALRVMIGSFGPLTKGQIPRPPSQLSPPRWHLSSDTTLHVQHSHSEYYSRFIGDGWCGVICDAFCAWN